MNKTAWIIFSVFTVGLLAVLVIFSTNSRIDVSKVDINKIQTASGQNGHIADHVLGNSDSKVVMIEYADFECPGCASASPTFKNIANTYSKQIAFVFRNYPLTTIHPNAKAAAAAAEAAGLQGKYWEMHDKLYTTQNDWATLNDSDRKRYFDDLANQLGLKIAKFDSDMISTAIQDKINFDTALGKKAGVNATPTIYLNGKAIDPEVWSKEDKLKQALNEQLKNNNIPLP